MPDEGPDGRGYGPRVAKGDPDYSLHDIRVKGLCDVMFDTQAHSDCLGFYGINRRQQDHWYLLSVRVIPQPP